MFLSVTLDNLNLDFQWVMIFVIKKSKKKIGCSYAKKWRSEWMKERDTERQRKKCGKQQQQRPNHNKAKMC